MKINSREQTCSLCQPSWRTGCTREPPSVQVCFIFGLSNGLQMIVSKWPFPAIFSTKGIVSENPGEFSLKYIKMKKNKAVHSTSVTIWEGLWFRFLNASRVTCDQTQPIPITNKVTSIDLGLGGQPSQADNYGFQCCEPWN